MEEFSLKISTDHSECYILHQIQLFLNSVYVVDLLAIVLVGVTDPNFRSIPGQMTCADDLHGTSADPLDIWPA